MKYPPETYVKGMHRKFDLYPAWLPNQPRALGDVGRLENGRFHRVTTLEKLGITFTERIGPTGEDLSHTSGKNVSVQFKGAGQSLPGANIPQAKAGALVEFQSSGAFVFQAHAPTVLEIEDQAGLAIQILDKFRSKKRGKREWQEDWCVITELVTAERVTVLIADSESAKIELSAEGVIPTGPVPLASAEAGLKVESKKGEVTSVLAAGNLSPMFALMRVRRGMIDWLLDNDDSADLVRAAAGGGKGALEYVPVKDWEGKTTRPLQPKSDPSDKTEEKPPKKEDKKPKPAKKSGKPAGKKK